ncbi:MAG TPA: indolepyruvate oxidoreductase subunit beta [Anaerolineae bacterium]|nr:indolepyruvate oxidoreductase subunit beta [Anaerolineae bacterium]HOR00314.1 indolepyruvate oxidoreductase subunit beta [Anaerolineae bacterium]HPL28604.1 indolepyruvate oxidoreductase subunit beta [Anaerolineae bacterium]
MNKADFLLVGVGGQGTLLASDVLAAVGLRAGYDVKKSEVHGMAQRGGSVTSHVRWAGHVFSPLIGRGEADFLLAFEKLEAARFAHLVRPGAAIVVNDHAIPPVSVSVGSDAYPTDADVRRALEAVSPQVHLVPCMALAEALGNSRVNNVVLLGALSRFVEVDEALWLEAIAERVPARTQEINRAAFLKGREAT